MTLILPLLLVFLAIFVGFLAFFPWDSRPKLKLDLSLAPGVFGEKPQVEKKSLLAKLFDVVRKVAYFNKPLTKAAVGQRIYRDLSLAQIGITIEEFLLIKQIIIVVLVLLCLKTITDPSFIMFAVLMSIAAGYMLPELWLKTRVKKVKEAILKDLPDTVDLLGLCVNAGLDFMMALRYVVEKSKVSVLTLELRNLMQEINVGKPRRDALRDLARKYEMPDLATFARTLIQADRMGTSVSEALNILSEDMRETRFRRGEETALKAPLKMLVPLLFCIFPVVGILVAGPIFLDFMHNNPLQKLSS